MINYYFRQAWELLKQNKLFSTLYIVGTGISVSLVMTMFVIFYIKFAPVYPEYNRNRMLTLKSMKCFPKDNPESWNCNSGVSYYVVSHMLRHLPHLEAIGAGTSYFMGNNQVMLPGRKEMMEVSPFYADAGFWDVFTFRFLCGKPYTQADVDVSNPVAVLSKGLAERIFASTDVEGKFFIYNGKEYRVCGVVDDVSNATPDTAGDLWLPLFHCNWITQDRGVKLTGNAKIYLLAPTVRDKETLREEVLDVFRKYNLQADKYEHDLMEQPDDFWKSTFRQNACGAPDIKELLKSFLYMLLALLFIPALNLSGMISSRMDHRLCELGVRKAYGATNKVLLTQILYENVLLTFLGGVVGLLISYLLVFTANEWILTLFDDYVADPTKVPFLTFEMLFNPFVFGLAFCLCVILNLISAFIPAMMALRHPIIESIHSKR